MAVSLPQGAVKELHTHEGEYTKNRDDHQHQHNAEGYYAFFSSLTSDVPRHAAMYRAREKTKPRRGATRQGLLSPLALRLRNTSRGLNQTIAL